MPRPLPLPERLADTLERQIRAGTYAPGDKLPSLREIAKLGACGKNTVVTAFEILVARGLAEPRRGIGFFVKPLPVDAAPRHDMTASISRAMNIVWMLKMQMHIEPGHLSVGDAFPPSEWLAGARLDRYHHKVARGGLGSLFRYGDRLGYAPLRQRLARKLGESGIAAQPSQILLTHGANEAMDLIVRYFVAPGTPVLIDDPGYYPLFGKLQLAGAHVIGVPRQADGPDVTALERLLERWRPRLFFTHSVCQNPTGSDLSAAKARRILELAERYDLRLVENDALVDFKDGPGARLSGADELQRTMYLGTFSKSLSAALRVGFVAASEDVIEGLADLRSLVTVSSSEYCERTVETLMGERHYRAHLESLRSRLAETTARAVALFASLGAEVFVANRQSLYLWARLPGVDDTMQFARAMLEQRIVVAPGAIFSVDGKGSSGWARYNVHAVLDPRFAAAVRRLARRPPPRRRATER